MISMEHMKAVFAPRGVAVVGATERVGSVGRTVVENLLSTYTGIGPNPFEIYGVNPGREEVLGVKCYPSVSAITTGLCEQVVIITPASKCVDVVRDCCLNKSVKVVVVIAAGFKEVGPEGLALENELVRVAAEGGIAVIGPNCLGVQSPAHQLNSTFAATGAKKGSAAFVSQSGAMCTAVLDWATQIDIGFSAFLSIGSMAHVDWSHCIEYLGTDENTKAIFIYMETIGNAKKFMKAARMVAPHKPIVLIKAGKTEAAAAAAVSHTGSLAGSHDAFLAAMQRAGCLVVDTIDELQNIIMLTSMQPKPTTNKLVIVTNAGGPGVLSTDAASNAGLNVCSLDDALVKKMGEFLPAAWSKSNPIDLIGDARSDVYEKSVKAVMENAGRGHALLVVLSPQSVTEPMKTAECIAEVVNKDRKEFDGPVVCAWMGGKQIEEGRQYLLSRGIPCFYQPDIAAAALGLLHKQVENASALADVPFRHTNISKEKALECIAPAQKEGRTILTESESKAVLKAYGIEVAESLVCQSVEEAVSAANQVKFPCVIKLNSETITHKSDVGGVKLNIRDETSVRTAFQEIKSNVDLIGAHHFQGVSVQPMLNISDGVELLIGSTCDNQFGPMVVFGAGGCLVEIFKDAAMSVPPVDRNEAERLSNSTRISKALLAGHGDRFKGCPIESVYDNITKFSFAITDLYESVAEFEINPILALKDRVIALDARLVLRAKDDSTNVAPPCLTRVEN